MNKTLQKILVTLIISLLFSGCATLPEVKPNTTTQQGYTLKLKIIKQSQYPMSENNTQVPLILGYDQITFLPFITKSGSLHVTVNRRTLDRANLDSFSYLLKKDGKTLSKWTGRWEQAEIPISNKLWWNTISIDTKGILTPGIYTLYVKDNVTALDVRKDGLSIFEILVAR